MAYYQTIQGISTDNKGVTETTPQSQKETIINFNIPKDLLQAKTHQTLQSPTRSNGSGASTCRICHEGDLAESLISPCRCTGTVALVHQMCLETWLSLSNSECCEICKFSFRTSKAERTFKEWLNSENSILGPNGFYGDLLCIFLLTPLCFISSYFCAAGAFTYFIKGQWEGIGLAIICLTVLLGYILWVYITIMFHLRCLKSWRESNLVIQLASPVAAPREPSRHMPLIDS